MLHARARGFFFSNRNYKPNSMQISTVSTACLLAALSSVVYVFEIKFPLLILNSISISLIKYLASFVLIYLLLIFCRLVTCGWRAILLVILSIFFIGWWVLINVGFDAISNWHRFMLPWLLQIWAGAAGMPGCGQLPNFNVILQCLRLNIQCGSNRKARLIAVAEVLLAKVMIVLVLKLSTSAFSISAILKVWVTLLKAVHQEELITCYWDFNLFWEVGIFG